MNCPADGNPDPSRRFWLRATEIAGGVAIVATACPFVASLLPSERARAEAGPTLARFAGLRTGEMMTVAWRGMPIWILRRDAAEVQSLRRPNPVLADALSRQSEQPEACRNDTRSLRPDLFVCIGICTHLGCSPRLRQEDESFDARIHGRGGFLCPCHGSMFDLAGRVVKNVPAPTNLVIPQYRFAGEDVVVIG